MPPSRYVLRGDCATMLAAHLGGDSVPRPAPTVAMRFDCNEIDAVVAQVVAEVVCAATH